MGSEWNQIFNVTSNNFQDLALEVFQFQYQHNPVYKTYVDAMKFNPRKINDLSRIPFLPIQFFKTHRIKTTDFEASFEFESSGTTQTTNSHHFVNDIEFYRQSFTKAFEIFYGPARDWCILGLLPSYLERSNSSLVFMVDELIRKSGHEQSGFYLHEYDKLLGTLKALEEKKQKTLLIGVTFALLDFAGQHSFPLKHTTIMETGGMKGRGEELVRDQVHKLLKDRFQVDVVHSEYGMTELLSQAYSRGNGVFHCPPWMKVLIRDEEDPLEVQSSEFRVQSPNVDSHHPAVDSRLSTHDSSGRQRLAEGAARFTARGVINIIDLANIYSCSFIATDDAGNLYTDGSFEVIGRIDNSDIRGCSLIAI
jgi:hypothetical protein